MRPSRQIRLRPDKGFCTFDLRPMRRFFTALSKVCNCFEKQFFKATDTLQGQSVNGALAGEKDSKLPGALVKSRKSYRPPRKLRGQASKFAEPCLNAKFKFNVVEYREISATNRKKVILGDDYRLQYTIGNENDFSKGCRKIQGIQASPSLNPYQNTFFRRMQFECRAFSAFDTKNNQITHHQKRKK